MERQPIDKQTVAAMEATVVGVSLSDADRQAAADLLNGLQSELEPMRQVDTEGTDPAVTYHAKPR